MNPRPDIAAAMQGLRPKNVKDAFEGKEKRSRKKEPGADSKYTAEEKAKMDAEGKGLSGASKAWAEKFTAMNDTEFWLCFCFNDEESKEAFLSKSVFGQCPGPRPGVIDGEEVARKLGLDLDSPVPQSFDKGKRMKLGAADIKFRQTYLSHPHPYTVPEPSGDLSTDMFSEVAGIRSALLKGQDPEWAATHADALDKPHWFVVPFRDRKHREVFVGQTFLGQIGDKYVDGHKAAVIMGIDL